MGKLRISISLALLLVSCSTFASDKRKSTIDSIATKVLQLTPSLLLSADQKEGAREYLATIGINAYTIGYVKGGNDGLRGYFSEVEKKNSRFFDLSEEFWREAISTASLAHLERIILNDELLKKSNLPIEQIFSPKGVFGARLLDVTGEGRLSKLSPGWLWTMALKYSRGDKNLALYLIASHGNDDYGILPKQKFTLPDGEKAKLLELKEQLKNKMPDRAAEISNFFDEVERKAFDQGFVLVGPETIVFARRALGPDVPSEVIQRLIAIQGGSSPAKLPSKSYHIYAAAFQGCVLHQRGLSGTLIQALQSRLVIGYRSAWLCEDLSQTPKLNKDIEGYLGLKRNSPQFEEAFKTEIAALMYAPSFNAACEVRPKDYSLCAHDSVVRRFFSTSGVENKKATSSDVDRYAKYLLARMDLTSTLDTLFGNLFSSCGEGILIRANAIYDHFKDLVKAPQWYFPRSFSKERVEAAHKMAETWIMDYDYTLAQHRAGVQFGIQECRVLGEGEASPPGKF